MDFGSDPQVCTFCTHLLPNAEALFLHYEYVHAEWVKDLFEAKLMVAPSRSLRELREADRVAMEGVRGLEERMGTSRRPKRRDHRLVDLRQTVVMEGSTAAVRSIVR